MDELGFPLGVRLTHWFNLLFLTLLARSGLAILSAHPKLYWNKDARPGTQWLDLLRKPLPTDRMWCSSDEEAHWPGWLVLPGGEALGLGRYWHFCSASLWFITGIAYALVLFLSPQWQRLVPTSWEIIPCAWRTALEYLQLGQPEPVPPYTYDPSLPFNALQQLTYFGLIFILTPFQIITGLAQSPSILGRFPWLQTPFRSRQGARSLHFLGLLAYGAFLVGHLIMVFWHGFAREMDKMVLGLTHSQGTWVGVGIGLGIVAAVALFHFAASLASNYARRPTHRFLSGIVDPIREHLLHGLWSAQTYPESELSPYFRANGYRRLRPTPRRRVRTTLMKSCCKIVSRSTASK